jgi:DNA-binding response OmpR family regulator
VIKSANIQFKRLPFHRRWALTEEKINLLIVEDDLDVADMLQAYFQVQGYQVNCAHWGQDALQYCGHSRPDLIILDIRLPDLDGYEIAKRLRSHRRTKAIPILFLTDKRSRTDKLLGLSLGADDYITKPFDVKELQLRVRNAIQRAKRETPTNHVTGLPQGALVEEKLSEYIRRENWQFIIVEIKNLDLFRETYGFVASDDVLRAINHILKSTILETGSPPEFLGHLSPTSFLLIASEHPLQELKDCISSRIAQSVDYFYPLKDRTTARTDPNRLLVRIKHLSAEDGPFVSHRAVLKKLFEEM